MSRRSVLRRLLDSTLAMAVIVGAPVGTPLHAQVPSTPVPSRFPGTSVPPPLVAAQTVAPAQPLRFTRNVPGEAAPIELSADQITTWYESEQTIAVILRGQVFVQQGTVQIHCEQAIARFDLKSHRDRGIWQMDLFAEGQVHMDTSADTKEGPSAVVDLTTRGEIKLHSIKNKTLQQVQSNDPLYRRALAERVRLVNQPGVIQTVGTPSVAMPIVPAPRTPLGPTGPPAALPSLPVSPFGPMQTPVKPLSAAPAPGNMVVRAAADLDGGGGDQVAQLPQPIPQPPLPNNVPSPLSGPPSGGPAVVTPPVPLGPPSRPVTGPQPTALLAPGRTFSVRPRFGTTFSAGGEPKQLENGGQAIVINDGVIISVRGAPGVGQVDIEADRCVIFTHGKSPMASSLQQPQAVGEKNKLEFYLAGNVEIREIDAKKNERVLRADEIYYDVDRNVAIALSARLELRQPNLPEPIVFRADELLRTSKETYEIGKGGLSASKLPSNPGLEIYFATATVEEKSQPKITIFGQEIVNRATGSAIIEKDMYVRARNVVFEVEGIPIFYLPYLAGNLNDPLGPVQSLSAGYNQVYGATFGVTLNAYDLIGVQPLEGTKWRLMFDYLSLRGPAVGTDFSYGGAKYLGLPSDRYEGDFKAYGIYDGGVDNVGGQRPVVFTPTAFRDRINWRQGIYDLPYGFTVQSQLATISDRNFMEAYYKSDWDTDLNQNSYAYVKQQGDFWAWTGLVDDRLGREWVTATEWLPRVDGYAIGVAPFDLLTYDVHANAAYARLRTSNDPGFTPLSRQTDVATNTGRFDVIQDLSLPFYLGPVKVVPYIEADFAYYSEDVNGDSRGRVWGGGGVRASIPFTRLFPDVQSELFNLNGINHKIVLSSNYFYSQTSSPHTLFPQLDRLNDDASDQSVRDVREFGYLSLPLATQIALPTSTLFDPQYYAMRRLLDTNPDALDAMQVLQLDLNQRWQTKRGYPGTEHIVDWMTLDLSMSVFPQPNRDNYGSITGFLEYDWTWNIGDRTTLVSSGLVDPAPDGARVFTLGAFLNRTDRTNFYLGYRQIDPLDSKAVVAAVTYIFSPKYAMTFTATYDFGAQVQSDSLVFTRTGTDLRLNLGLTFNSLQQNVGAVFEIIPNLASNMRNGGGGLTSLAGPGGPLH